jgi:hypothetical protein
VVEVEEVQHAIQGGDEVHEQELKLKSLKKKTTIMMTMIAFLQMT